MTLRWVASHDGGEVEAFEPAYREKSTVAFISPTGSLI